MTRLIVTRYVTYTQAEALRQPEVDGQYVKLEIYAGIDLILKLDNLQKSFLLSLSDGIRDEIVNSTIHHLAFKAI